MIVAKIRVDFACANTVWANPITAGMAGAEVEIEYAGSEWDGLTKTVVFSGAVVKDVISNDTIIRIPAECLAVPNALLKVGVYGITADETIAIPTLWAPIGRVLRGTDPSGDESTNPALPVWAAIMEKANTAEQIAQDLRKDAEDGRFNGRPGDDGHTPEKGVDYFTPSEVAGIEAGAAKKLEPELSKVKDDITAEAKRAKEAEDNRVKKFYTGNQGAVSVADSDDGAVRNLVIGGRSEQIATKGYQLIDLDTVPNEKRHNYHFDRASGIYEFSAESAYRPNRWVLQVNPNSDMVFSVRALSNNSVVQVSRYMQDQDNGLDVAIVTPAIKRFNTGDFTEITFSIYSSGAGDFIVDGIMLEYGTTAHDWEPYTGGAPSPSPDYPQEIKSVENCSMTVSNADGTETQTAAIPFTLRGIGDVRDELYVFADGTGKLVQCYPTVLDPAKTVAEQALTESIETALTAEQVKALFDLRTYYGGTNISYQSENGVEPVVNFDYACALENFVEYIKAAQGDDRKFIYDMDERLTQAEVMALEASIDTQIMEAMMEV